MPPQGRIFKEGPQSQLINVNLASNGEGRRHNSAVNSNNSLPERGKNVVVYGKSLLNLVEFSRGNNLLWGATEIHSLFGPLTLGFMDRAEISP